MAVAEYVCQLLDAKAGFETVSVKEEATKLRLLGRVPAAAQLSWKAVRLALLLAGETEKDRPWSCDVSRQYFLVDGVERYAWRLIIQSAGTPLDVLLPELIELFGRVNVPAGPGQPEEEVPLYGSSSLRTALKKGKGAQGVLKAVVGRDAAEVIRQGG
jgi:hypothetical protein